MAQDLVALVHAVPLGGSDSSSTPVIVSFNTDPTASPGIAAAKGSVGLRTDTGALYLKTNSSSATAWTAIGAVPGSFSPSAVWFGDGIDGSVTFDGTSTVLGITPSSNKYLLSRDIFLADMSSINSGVTIVNPGFRIFVAGALTNNGTISADGGAGGVASSYGGGSCGTPGGGYYAGQAGGGGSGSNGPGAGSNGTSSGTS